MRRIAWLLVVAVVVGAAGWYGSRKIDRCPGCHALDAHRRQWDSLRITDYSYVYQEGGMACCYRVRITVRGGRVVRAEVLHALSGFRKAPTVDDVFAAARHEMHVGDHVEVEYDTHYGFPRSVSVDPRDHVIDDEYGFQIEQFHAMTPANA